MELMVYLAKQLSIISIISMNQMHDNLKISTLYMIFVSLPYIILFAERINNLESELRNKELELRKRDMAILGLKLQVEAADVKREFQPKIEEISIQAVLHSDLSTLNNDLSYTALNNENSFLTNYTFSKICL